MYSHPQHLTELEAQELRRSVGVYLKELREKRDLTQRHLASLVAAEHIHIPA